MDDGTSFKDYKEYITYMDRVKKFRKLTLVASISFSIFVSGMATQKITSKPYPADFKPCFHCHWRN